MEDISEEILTLDALKATQRNNNPTKIIKEIFFYFYFFFKKTLITFSDKLNCVDVKEVLKKDSRIIKKNYRPVSIPLNVCKIYERSLDQPIEECFQALLFKYQYGFRKGYSVINVLLATIENDEGVAFGALLINLSLVFDCLHQEL